MTMKNSTCIGSVLVILISIFQLCPAPPAIVAAGISAAGAVAGGLGGAAISNGNKRKRIPDVVDTAAFFSRYPVAWEACQNQLGPASVTMTAAGDNGARFDGVPPACMTLASAYLGENPDPQSAPIVLGTASLLYNNLTPEELNTLKQALDVTNGVAPTGKAPNGKTIASQSPFQTYPR